MMTSGGGVKYKGSVDCFVQVMKNEGFMSLMKGAGALVLDSAAGGHHHPPPDGVDGVGHQASRDGDSPSQEEGEGHSSISSEEHGLQGIVQSKVHTTVDEDTDGRDGETS